MPCCNQPWLKRQNELSAPAVQKHQRHCNGPGSDVRNASKCFHFQAWQVALSLDMPWHAWLSQISIVINSPNPDQSKSWVKGMHLIRKTLLTPTWGLWRPGSLMKSKIDSSTTTKNRDLWDPHPPYRWFLKLNHAEDGVTTWDFKRLTWVPCISLFLSSGEFGLLLDFKCHFLSFRIFFSIGFRMFKYV